MTYAIGVIAFVVALLVSVMLHEFGHFLTAKAFGMKASRFFVGFGPTLWSFRRGETEYGIKAIPAGGFVKIEGMTQLEELEPGDEDRAFWKQPPGKRTIVLAAGSFVHFILAIVIVFGVLASTHQDPLRAYGEVAGVEACLPQPNAAKCPPNAPAPPAAGKLQTGDVITAVDGRQVTATQLIDDIKRSAGKPLELTVLRHGQTRTVRVTPAAVREKGATVGKLGFSANEVPAHVSVAGAFPRTFTALGDYAALSAKAIGGLPSEIAGIFEGKPRNPNGAASVIDVANVEGQITASGAPVGTIIAQDLLIIAELNFFVGIFNLLPLLPLDGGHIAIVAFEEGRKRLYRLFGRRDPGRVDILKILPVTYAVVAVFIALSLILIYAGITNPISIQ